ncbi:MAG: ATP-binding protein [Syntrophales bacterium]|jgi:signal transduction histidine kinase|nr:ATP-binding protein [Syntrophales bacterium]MCK9528709.1 ATP-binding protein [Syntrophales bacterium]MDX9922662.1 ATP-binding protein [Syntrophales bacterium]
MSENDAPPEEERDRTPGPDEDTKAFSSYIIPLTVFLVVAVFVSLILIMGFMDLRRLDGTLVEFMENRGLDIVATIENVAQEDLDFLVRTQGGDLGYSIVELSETEYHIRQRFVNSLIRVAQKIEGRQRDGTLSQKDLDEIAAREKVTLIAVLNWWGRVTLLSGGTAPDEPLYVPLSRRGEQEKLMREFFESLGLPSAMSFVAALRSDGQDLYIIALDEGKTKYWATRIAVEKVVGGIGWEHELAWLDVTDREGNILGEAGDLPEAGITAANLPLLNVPEGKDVASRKLQAGGSHFLEVAAPLHLDGDVVGYARLGLKWNRARSILAENRNRMTFTTVILALIGTLATVGLYRNQANQLHRVEEMKKRLRRAEHLSALGQLAAGVAHEIRNPLNAISIATQRLQREFSPRDEDDRDDFSRISGVIRDEIRRLNGIIEEFVTFFRIRRMELHPRSLEEVLRKMLAVMEAELQDGGIILRSSLEGETLVSMDADKLTQALYNIVKNAAESISGTGTICVDVEPRPDSRVAVVIADTGSGLAPDELEQIFNPEYTTKEKGLGLGLTLAHDIIDGHGGEIHAASNKGRGTTFEIILPLCEPRSGDT